jgi:hypothetical protein
MVCKWRPQRKILILSNSGKTRNILDCNDVFRKSSREKPFQSSLHGIGDGSAILIIATLAFGPKPYLPFLFRKLPTGKI